MRYSLRHLTRFRYDSPVRFARCNLHLQPIDWQGQKVDSYGLHVEPAAAVTPGLANGYPVLPERLLLTAPASTLAIESRSTVTVDRVAPAAEAGDPSVAEAAALALAAADFGPLAPANFLYPSPLIAAFAEIADWCARELQADRGIVEAGLALATAIQRDFHYDGSATELETSPAEAFAARRGVCQDFAQIMISGARAAGLAAAYVSGYLRTLPPEGGERLIGADATHAWVMLWCGPDRGWLGFDPTNGCTVGGDHIVCAVGRDYADVAPVSGIFLGQVGQRIDVEVDVVPLD